MSVKKESSGRRSVQIEVEVPGTPEEVWRAIGTGPGISSWFVPTELEEKLGGKMKLHFGPGMDSIATITAWEPPIRFAAEDSWGEGSPTIATEWFVEARSGGMCIVRVVHSLFSDTDDWDNQLEGTENGWPIYFRVLRYFLEHFRGMRSQSMVAIAMSSDSSTDTWRKLTESLGKTNPNVGERIKTNKPALSGKVEWVRKEGNDPAMILHLDSPNGIGLFAANKCGGTAMASVSLYLFGETAENEVGKQESGWQEWLNAQFPAPETKAD